MEKHIKRFESFRKNKEITNETVFSVDDVFRVNIIVDVPMKIVTSYAKKVEQNTQKKLLDNMSNSMVAEELVKYVVKEGLDVEKISATALIGGQAQAQGSTNVEIQPTQTQGQAQPEVRIEEPTDNFEEVQGENLPQ